VVEFKFIFSQVLATILTRIVVPAYNAESRVERNVAARIPELSSFCKGLGNDEHRTDVTEYVASGESFLVRYFLRVFTFMKAVNHPGDDSFAPGAAVVRPLLHLSDQEILVINCILPFHSRKGELLDEGTIGSVLQFPAWLAHLPNALADALLQALLGSIVGQIESLPDFVICPSTSSFFHRIS